MGPDSYAGERPASEIVQNLMRDLADVIRGETRLAKAEIAEKVSEAGKAGGLLGGAALCGVMGFAALTACAIAALALAVPLWAAAAIVGALLLSAGGGLYAGGRAKIRQVNPTPERTVRTLKDDVEWAKNLTK